MTVNSSRMNLRTVLIISLVSIGLVLEIAYILFSPAFPVLPFRVGGIWIRPNVPVNLQTYGDKFTQASFRKRIEIAGSPTDISLSITAFRDVAVFLDGHEIPIGTSATWKKPIAVAIPTQLLNAGSHELRLEVSNRMAHPAVHIKSDFEGLANLSGWESSIDGSTWIQALPCDGKWDVPVRGEFPTTWEGIRKTLPILLPLSMLSLMVSIRPGGLLRKIVQPPNLRYLLLFLWIVLCCNNMFKIPITAGFDATFHYDYVVYLLKNHRLPLATDGIQMFQPPVFYLLSSAVYKVLEHLLTEDTIFHLLRIIQTLSGLALIEITFRTLRMLFPDNKGAQSCGLVIGSLLPMNIYMCQYVGNEPLAGALSAVVLYLAVRMFNQDETIRPRDAAQLGMVTGLAILTKVTPILLVPVICIFLALCSNVQRERSVRWWKMLVAFLTATSLVSGWYFVRNWVLLGKPFIGGWDPDRNFVWWQDPSYRLFRDFYSFGESLFQPVYACFNSFSDAVYSTFWHDGYLGGKIDKAASSPWNYELLATGTVLSLIPFIAMTIGVILTIGCVSKKETRPLSFFLAAILVYFSALIYLYASLPIFSTAKASYTMGLTPCYAAMAALGAAFIFRFEYLKNIFVSILIIWAVITYGGFFVV